MYDNNGNNHFGMEVMMFYLLVAIGVFLSSCSQILLKKSALIEHATKVSEILNKQVIVAYFVFFLSVIFNVIALRYGVEVKDLPILEALGYVFVPFLSLLFLKERISRKSAWAILMIIGGIIVFYI